jgi:integrase/recombinase XerD
MAPLLREREMYLAHLLRRGTSHFRARSVAAYLIHIVRLMGLTQLRPVGIDEIERAGRRWAKYKGPHRRKSAGKRTAAVFAGVAKNWFRFHGHLKVRRAPDHPFDELLRDFVRFLRLRQGLAPETIKGYSSRAGIFLRWLHDRGQSLSSLSLVDVDQFLVHKTSVGWKPRTIAAQGQAIRSFLAHAAARGWCRAGMDRGIRTPAIPKYDQMPRGPSWKEVRRLLQSTRGSKPADRRALAALSLFSIYGLRSSEVARLRLSDFNWHDEILTVQRAKRGGLQRYPIQYEVGEAILAYLTRVRPRSSSRHVFLTISPPFRPVGASSMWQLTYRRMKQFKIESAHKGPHALRHACATHLLRRGSSVREIAEFLGHRDAKSIGIYAKFDKQSLRKVAAFRLTGVA